MQREFQIPAAAIDALRHGMKVEAIKILRNATGLGLKEAKDVIDGYSEDGYRPQASPMRVGSTPALPPQAVAAMQRGEVITAIKLLRDANPQLDLRTLKDMVTRLQDSRGGGPAPPQDAAAAPRVNAASAPPSALTARVPTVSQGDAASPVWLLTVVIAVIAVVAWWFFSG